MGIRYSDASKEANEFVTRERSPSIMQLIMLFVSTFIISVTLSLAVADQTLLTIILMLILTSVGWYVILQIQRNRDLVLATEFQNALFTSALGSNNKFCIIIKHDGTLTYMDRAFHDMFFDFVKLPYRHIDALLKYGEVSQEECAKIYGAIEHNVNDSIVFTIRASDNKPHKIVMTVEPITRPSGYILMRARDFVEQRTSAPNATPGTISAVKIDPAVIQLFSGVIGNAKSAFIADPAGILLYVSPQLEVQLGYNSMEMLSRNFSIQDFVYVGGSKPDALALEDYEGDIIFQKKDGALIKGHIQQSLLKDKSGKLVGCTAIFTDQESAASVKKNSW
jgi:PAS domain-containing protein